MAGGAEKDRKLFLGGLDFSATEDDIVTTFSKYGSITDQVIITKDGDSRGFGFVTFSTAAEAQSVLDDDEEITMHGRPVDIKKALPREDEQPVKKLYVGRIGELSKDELQSYFAQFGAIEDVIMPMTSDDEPKNRGFVFILYADSSVTPSVLDNPNHRINGTDVEVKKATQRPRRGGFGGGGGGGRGGGFRSFGGRDDSYGGGGGGGGGYRSSYGGGGGGSYGGSKSYSGGGGGSYNGSGGYGDSYGSQGSSFGPVRGGRSSYGGSSGGPYGGGGSYGSGGGGGGGGGYSRSRGGGGRRY